jgi:hypothetical protein
LSDSELKVSDPALNEMSKIEFCTVENPQNISKPGKKLFLISTGTGTKLVPVPYGTGLFIKAIKIF